jgi:cysteinyl-tRNA synthetase
VSGTTIPVEALKDPGAVSRAVSPRPTHETPRETTATSLSHEVDRATVAFDEAMNSGTADSAVRAVLDLESAIHQWSADTLQSDETNRARAVLRSMVTRLGDAAVNGLIDPRLVIAPFVDTLMDLRAQVRTDKRYDLSDLIRDRLVETGVEVHDTPQGATWELRRPE